MSLYEREREVGEVRFSGKKRGKYLTNAVVNNVASDIVVVDFAALVRDNEEKVETRHDGVAHLDVVLRGRAYECE